MTARPFVVAALVVAAASPLNAQSVFNAAGLGLPMDALDARTRAMGNLGIGLPAASLLPSDPAAAAYYRVATGVMVAQPSWVEYAREAGGEGTFQGTRFPLVGVAYSMLSGTMSIQLASVLDQNFRSEAAGSVDLGGEPVGTVDVFEQDGSLSTLNVGYARQLGPRLAAGVVAGRYVGSVVRELTRDYDPAALAEDYVERGKWSYSGFTFTGGLASDLTEEVRLAVSVQVPTGLDADASSETDGQDGSYDLPLQLRAGATARLAPGLILTASGVYADWSDVADDLRATAEAGGASGFGVGVELSRASILGKQAPLRFGFRRRGLPFVFGADGGSERIFSGGFGLDLNRTEDVLLAGADFALERGLRSGGDIEERFWRLTISMVLSGS